MGPPIFFGSFYLNMSSILLVENLDTAAAAAGKVILEKLNRQLGQRDISAWEFPQALFRCTAHLE